MLNETNDFTLLMVPNQLKPFAGNLVCINLTFIRFTFVLFEILG